MNLNGVLNEFAERKEQISTASVLKFGRQRAKNVAAQLSRRGHMAAAAELCNEAVNHFIELCFEPDTDGLAANIDPVTGRVIIGCPWGRNGYEAYGLRRNESDVLRHHMFSLQDHGVPPLFIYDQRRWHLNFFDHRNFAVAIRYWQKHQLDSHKWRKIAQTLSGG